MKKRIALPLLATVAGLSSAQASSSRVCKGLTKFNQPFAIVVTDINSHRHDVSILLQIKGREAVRYEGDATQSSDVSAAYTSSENGGLVVELYDAPEAGPSFVKARVVGGNVKVLCDEAK